MENFHRDLFLHVESNNVKKQQQQQKEKEKTISKSTVRCQKMNFFIIL